LEVATIPKSTTLAKPGKPTKRHKDFRLFAHSTGRWAKKVCAELHYFEPRSEPQKPLDKWLDEKDASEHYWQVTEDYFERAANPDKKAS